MPLASHGGDSFKAKKSRWFCIQIVEYVEWTLQDDPAVPKVYQSCTCSTCTSPSAPLHNRSLLGESAQTQDNETEWNFLSSQPSFVLETSNFSCWERIQSNGIGKGQKRPVFTQVRCTNSLLEAEVTSMLSFSHYIALALDKSNL